MPFLFNRWASPSERSHCHSESLTPKPLTQEEQKQDSNPVPLIVRTVFFLPVVHVKHFFVFRVPYLSLQTSWEVAHGLRSCVSYRSDRKLHGAGAVCPSPRTPLKFQETRQ